MVKLMGTVAEEIFSMKLSRDVSAGEIVLVDIDAVSYTHLRAHETVLDLVCRLLLEKKNYKLIT